MSHPGVELAEYSVAVRESSLKRLRRVPVGFENWRPSSGALSLSELARHILAADEWFFRKLEDPSLRRMVACVGEGGPLSRAEFDDVLVRLEASGRRRAELLSSLANEDLSRLIRDDRFGKEVTVWWLAVRGNLDHEAHHRGQIATYIRLLEDQGLRRDG